MQIDGSGAERQLPPIGEIGAWAAQAGVLAAADQSCPVLFAPRGVDRLVVLHRCPPAGGHRARLGANSEAVRFESFAFGSIQIDGKTYDHDVVLDRGVIRKRDKKASRQLRSASSHTPLSLSEKIPWDCRRLVVGTGAQGALPLVPELRREAERRGVELVSLPTGDAIALLEKDSEGTNAVLHVTC